MTDLRFFYNYIMHQEIEVGFHLTKHPRRLPSVLTKEQVWKIISMPKNPKHRLMLMTTYAAGLMAGEVRRLKPEQIDNQRILIKMVDGKGYKDLFSMLSRMLLEEFRPYYQACRPKTYLLPSAIIKRKFQPISYEALCCTYC